MSDRFVVEGFRRRQGQLQVSERLEESTEGELFRRGRSMQHRLDGMVFYRIDTSASGDQWTEVEVLARTGETPSEAA